MTGAVLERPGSLFERPELDGGGTLEELLSVTLASARENGTTECPVCHARMSYTRAGSSPGATPAAGCGRCGSRLS